ncbi:acetyltransferase [Cycloclasticus pugetii]|uniref:acetyltransferase n=1 Tax=Cycloclasticus pugetii TaxID=34068 RepID=UPI003A902170
MKTLAILGASGHGKVIADIALLSGYGHIAFYDDAWPEKSAIGVWPIIGTSEDLLHSLEHYDACIVGIGNNSTRKSKQELLAKHQAPLVTLIHPRAVVSEFATMGPGTVVMANAVVNPFTCIGAGCIINTSATIDHDCLIHDFCHISPGVNVAGGVSIKESSWIGIGASIKQCINIGHAVVVGAGAVLVNDVPDKLIVVGCPARPINYKDH